MVVMHSRRKGFSRHRLQDVVERRGLVMSVGLWAACLSTVAMIAMV